MSSLICPNCRTPVISGESWCRQCGVRLDFSQPGIGAGSGYPSIPEYGLPRAAVVSPPFQQGYASQGGIWRDGNTLVMHKAAKMPDRCIKCGMETNGSHLRKKLTWHHPALALLIFAGVLIYLIVALIVRKSAVIDISVCEEHLRKHRMGVIVTWLVFLGGLGFMALAISTESGGSALFGMLLLFASAISAMSFARIVMVKKMDDTYIWLRGINERFLSLLPPLNNG